MNQQDPQPIQGLNISKSIWLLMGSIISISLVVASGTFWWQKIALQQELSSLNNQLKLIQQENENLSEQVRRLHSKGKAVITAKAETISQTGWKKLNSNEFAFSIENGWSYLSRYDDFSFSIDYPGDWQLKGSVFYDSNGNKIAEFSQGPVVLSANQECSDLLSEIESQRSRPISEANIHIGGKDGLLKISEAHTEKETWYPNIFCLSEGEKAFIMSFYQRDLGAGDRELFEKILATLKFE